ncbi:hypothetical protein M9H77_27692 [Catharanthus roseus]|uniref:Uncharacterized protein n=1 Tax=Catharanthus roseus TaxID=4058 RepID=A0ACC0ADL3_CATRO|nr:hypothetical protein M9H77_27692 [Catharanthus roseus]
MDSFKEALEENIGFEADEDPNTFKEFLDPEEYIDLGHLFTTDRIFSSKDELVHWAKKTAMNAKTYLIITRYQRSRTADRRPFVTLACERGGCKTCGQLQQTEQFRKSHVPPRNIVRFLREQDVACTVSAQKIYNVVAKINKNRTQGRNTVEEVLCLSVQNGYNIFHRNYEESNVLSDIVIAHPTSIAMIRTWQYVLIMDITYKTNKYNMPLLEAVGMTPTGKNFTVATAFMCNEQRKLEVLKTRWKSRPDFLH